MIDNRFAAGGVGWGGGVRQCDWVGFLPTPLALTLRKGLLKVGLAGQGAEEQREAEGI